MSETAQEFQPEEVSESMEQDRVRLLYSSLHLAIVTHGLIAAVLAGVLLPSAGAGAIALWLVLLGLALAYRSVVLIMYRRTLVTAQSAVAWLTRFRIGAAAVGLAWGWAMVWLFPSDDVNSQMLVAFAMTGLLTGAIGSLAADKVALLSLAVPLTLSLTARLFMADHVVSTATGALIIFFLAFMALNAQRFAALEYGNLRFRREMNRRENSLRRYAFIVNTVSDMMSVVNSEHRYEAVNDRWCELLGRSRESVLGHSLGEIWGEQRYATQIAPDLDRCIAEGAHVSRQTMLQFPGANMRECSITYYPYAQIPGRVTHVVVVTRDISEQVRAEKTLIAAREEADRANRAKSEFLSSMSHELRTPMNAILGFSQLMAYDDTLSGEQKSNVREILNAGHHLLELINDVLDLAKVESGSIELSLEPVAVDAVVEECLNLVGTLANKRDIRISYAGFKGMAVRADRTRFKQVLLNLLSNAIKYNREGGNVMLAVQAEGADRLRIRITDTGAGIPADRLKELFQPFNRLDAENSGIEGTGIGLTITRRIVELMGGTVDVESEVGVGSSFWIELPRDSALVMDAAAPAADVVDLPAPVAETAKYTVLYIEDNPANLRLVAQILGRRPHIHLLSAHTPELGIELAKTRRPELVLLDINMPGMDGYQVLERIRADPHLRDTPVIAVTANAMPRDIERGMAAGFSDYLAKPLDVTHFHLVVDKWLGAG